MNPARRAGPRVRSRDERDQMAHAVPGVHDHSDSRSGAASALSALRGVGAAASLNGSR